MDLGRRAPRKKGHDKPQWELRYLEAAAKEGHKVLDEIQYAYVIEAFDELAFAHDPRVTETHDVRPIYDFYELRDKGGHLGKINLRVYFSVHETERTIVVLSVYKKEDEGKAPERIVRRAKARLRHARTLIERVAASRERGR